MRWLCRSARFVRARAKHGLGLLACLWWIGASAQAQPQPDDGTPPAVGAPRASDARMPPWESELESEPSTELAGDDAIGFGTAGAPGGTADDAVGFGEPVQGGAADDALGFGVTAAAPAESTPQHEPGALRLSGFVREELSYLPEQSANALRYARSTFEGTLQYARGPLLLRAGLHAEGDLAVYAQRDELRPSERASYERWVLPWELYAEGRHRDLTVRIGRQIAVWGHATTFMLLDFANPLDRRIPLLGMPGERRLPLAMSRLQLEHGAHAAELIVVHQADYRFRPPPLGLYSVLPAVLASGEGTRGFLGLLASRDAAYEQEGQGFRKGAAQLLARYGYRGSGVELGVYAGWVTQQEGVILLPPPDALAAASIPLTVQHARYGVLAASFSSARGACVFFAEGLAELAKPINVGDLDAVNPVLAASRQSWLRGTLGLRYEGIDEGFLSFEITGGVRATKAPAHELAPLLPVAPVQLMGTYRQSFLRQRLELEQLLVVVGPALHGGLVLRSQIAWRLLDTLRAQLGYVAFFPGPWLSVISGFDDHDRFDLTLRWDFSAA